MLIHLHKSKLFTVDPAIRFSNEYGVPEQLWREMWRKHKLLDFTNKELREYFQMKSGTRINSRKVSRWIFRSEIYSMARPMMKEGVRTVNSNFFRQHEQKVINEVVRHIKYGVTKDSRIMA
jgi:hypothetical protein